MTSEGQGSDRGALWRSWMASAQRGDAEAYGCLLNELLPFVRNLVRRRLGEDPAAEDVVQEVLLSVHVARHTFRSERPLAPWVRAIARNAVIDHVRRRGRIQARRSELEVAELAAEEERPPSDAALSPALSRALEKLPDAQRQAVTLLKIEGLSVAEAAARVGVSQGALKLRAHRGYRALRDLLGRESL
jgi:RNA polymerase sigma-70 factor (ECF subfamily)